ncbi:MAG: LTA synthase family protein [Bacteroidales bacterium]|nr:LTA synthase family protein [Bacteroidales bacterium]
MKKQNNILKYLCLIIKIYVFWMVIFAVQKPVFMLFNHQNGISFFDYIQVILHGVKLDFCFTAYLLFIPIIVLMLSLFINLNLKKIIWVYHIIISVLLSIIFSVDCILFSYWGFRMDATLVFYLKDAKDAASSVTFKDVVEFILILVPHLFVCLFAYKKWIINYITIDNHSKYKILHSIILLVLLPIFFIFTRGGLSTATANIGMVYYSTNQFLNLSAINPAFSLLSSWTKKEDFSKEYQYMPQQEADDLFSELYFQTSQDTEYILNTQSPDILIILLESFSANAISCVGGEDGIFENKEVTPNINNLAKESLVFTNCYANAMRTDRGIVSVLTGFLAQPTMSIIKYPEKTRSLPTLAKVFSKKGYNTSMLYGGDINFANMRSYFVSSLYKDIVSLNDFSLKHRLSKWGVNDETTFDYLFQYIQKQDTNHRYFKTFLTLSSHEPFDVSMKKFSHPYLNSVTYTDSCLGSFINKIKSLPQWKNLLIILVADHGFAYPNGTKDYERKKYHIPMIWTGGALKTHKQITRYVNQTDIPATLLQQMNISSKDFVYSRNVLSPHTPNFAYYVFNNGFCLQDSLGYIIYDCNANYIIEGEDKNQKEKKGKAVLQKLYRDIEKK